MTEIVTEAPDRKLATLAQTANKAHGKIMVAMRTTYKQAVVAGEALKEAQKLAKKAGLIWKEWCRNNLDFSYETAAVYLRIYGNRADLEAAFANIGELTVSRALAYLRKPKAPPTPEPDTQAGTGGEENSSAETGYTAVVADPTAEGDVPGEDDEAVPDGDDEIPDLDAKVAEIVGEWPDYMSDLEGAVLQLADDFGLIVPDRATIVRALIEAMTRQVA